MAFILKNIPRRTQNKPTPHSNHRYSPNKDLSRASSQFPETKKRLLGIIFCFGLEISKQPRPPPCLSETSKHHILLPGALLFSRQTSADALTIDSRAPISPPFPLFSRETTQKRGNDGAKQQQRQHLYHNSSACVCVCECAHKSIQSRVAPQTPPLLPTTAAAVCTVRRFRLYTFRLGFNWPDSPPAVVVEWIVSVIMGRGSVTLTSFECSESDEPLLSDNRSSLVSKYSGKSKQRVHRRNAHGTGVFNSTLDAA